MCLDLIKTKTSPEFWEKKKAVCLEYILCLWLETTQDWMQEVQLTANRKTKLKCGTPLLVFLPYAQLRTFCTYKQISVFVPLATLSSTQHKTVSSLAINGVYCKKENAFELCNHRKRDWIWKYLNGRSRMKRFFYCCMWTCHFIKSFYIVL